MFVITKKRIINLDSYLTYLKQDAIFRIAVPMSEISLERLQNFGLTNLVAGDSILPAPYGPVSRFNANGRWIIFKNLPKEPRYLRTVMWHWKEWHGRDATREHSETRDIYKDCYVRDLLLPPAAEFTVVEYGGTTYLSSEVLQKSEDNRTRNKHIINVFLEIFGFCHIVHEDFAPVTTKTRRVNWKILPTGEHPWQGIAEYIREATKNMTDENRGIILDRQQEIMRYRPKECAIGQGGFHDYCAYIFENRKLVLLESIRKDNAIYVFSENWEEFSQMSKATILDEQFHLARIVHSQGWKQKVENLLKIPELV